MNLVYFTMSDHKNSVISLFYMEEKKGYVTPILYDF